jgi:hypothetical protein
MYCLLYNLRETASHLSWNNEIDSIQIYIISGCKLRSVIMVKSEMVMYDKNINARSRQNNKATLSIGFRRITSGARVGRLARVAANLPDKNSIAEF